MKVQRAIGLKAALLRAAYELFDVGQFFRNIRGKIFGSAGGDQDGVLHAIVLVLVREFDDGFDGDDLAGFDRAAGAKNVMRSGTYEVAGEAAPLIFNSRRSVDGFTGIGGFFVSVLRGEHGDDSFLRVEVDLVPLG